MLEPSNRIAVGLLPTEKFPSNAPSLARSLATVPAGPLAPFHVVTIAPVRQSDADGPVPTLLTQATYSATRPNLGGFTTAAFFLVPELMLLGIAVAWKYRHGESSNTVNRPASIAVLPLRNLSTDPEQEYFSDGMTDELITDLAKSEKLRVTSHTSVERYKNTRIPVPEIARELSVDAIVEGTVMRSEGRVRITVQLIDGRSDQHLWADSYERDLRDVLNLQDEVASRIAGEIGTNIVSRAQTGPSAAVRKENPGAEKQGERALNIGNKPCAC